MKNETVHGLRKKLLGKIALMSGGHRITKNGFKKLKEKIRLMKPEDVWKCLKAIDKLNEIQEFVDKT